MRLPQFLIIGAMKAGTTSLAADLDSLPDVFLPSVKEPHFLCNESVLSEAGTRDYARLFESATSNQICGEASTGYTKLPHARDVPKRARALLGADLRLIYIVRNPVDRVISHHYHMSRANHIARDINEAVRTSPSLIEYSRYWMQLRAWLEHFGSDRFRVILFEEYVRNQSAALENLAAFLGVAPVDAVRTVGPRNTGESVLVARPGFQSLIGSVTRSKWYKIYVHPRLPRSFSDIAKAAFMRRSPERPAPPTAETVREIIRQVEEDAEQLRQWMGRGEPLWDFDQTLSGLITGAARRSG